MIRRIDRVWAIETTTDWVPHGENMPGTVYSVTYHGTTIRTFESVAAAEKHVREQQAKHPVRCRQIDWATMTYVD